MKKNFFLFLLVFIPLFSVFTNTQIKADQIAPAIIDVKSTRSKSYEYSIYYTNEEEINNSYQISILNYNPQNYTTLEGEIFVQLISASNFELNPNDTKEINFLVNVPENISAGTYFNLLSIYKQGENSQSNVSVHGGIGAIIALHIEADDKTLSQSAKDDITSTLSIENLGDFFHETVLNLTISNKSNYVMHADLTANVLNTNLKEPADLLTIDNKANSEYKKFTIYPGETKQFPITFKFWNRNNFYKKFKVSTILKVENSDHISEVYISLISVELLKKVLIVGASVIAIFILFGAIIKASKKFKKEQDKLL